MDNLVNVLSWLIFGSAIGAFAYIIEPNIRDKHPFVLGVLGAVFSGIITNTILNIPLHQFSLTSFMVALSGACFLVFSTGLFRRV